LIKKGKKSISIILNGYFEKNIFYDESIDIDLVL
jgi:hypothetical protein